MSGLEIQQSHEVSHLFQWQRLFEEAVGHLVFLQEREHSLPLVLREVADDWPQNDLVQDTLSNGKVVVSLVESLHFLAYLHAILYGHVHIQQEQRNWLEVLLSIMDRHSFTVVFFEHFLEVV